MFKLLPDMCTVGVALICPATTLFCSGTGFICTKVVRPTIENESLGLA